MGLKILSIPFTKSLNFTDTPTITLDESDGVRAFTIKGTSTTAVTVAGTGRVAGFSSGTISLTDTDDALTIMAIDGGGVLTGITISVPSGATADFIAVK